MTALANSGNCFKCGNPGHWVQHCPLNQCASSMNEHLARIQLLIERWVEHEITQQEKARLIIAENELWNDKTGAKTK